MEKLPRIIPSREEVLAILSKTGALREGHFELPTGRHTAHYLQMPLAMRHYWDAKMLSVALSRLLRSDVEIAKHLPNVSIVCPATGGLPVAYGVGEALRAQQIYWAERQPDGSMQFRQFMEVHDHEKVILVDDILRSGRMLREMMRLFADKRAQVLALGVIVRQPNPELIDLGQLPVYSLVEMNLTYYADAASCELCKAGQPFEKLWV
jgi:orotate phosphoribosyltransferase